jgi:hypothetical protein
LFALAGFWDSAQAGVLVLQEFDGVEGFLLEVGAVGGDEEPVLDGSAEEVDGAEGWEVARQAGVGRVGGFREDQPEAVVFRGLDVVAEPQDDFVADVDGIGTEGGFDLWMEGFQGFQDEGVGWAFASLFW